MADLFDIVTARKLSGGGGGGGSSDFSTAEVTITITAGESYLQIPTVVSTPMDAILNRQVNTMSGEVSLIVPLYKGSLALSASAIVAAGASVNVTGDIQYMGRGGILITGDGTITIS